MAGYSWKHKNDTYILSEAQSSEVEDYSDSQPDDNLFNAWFEDYVKKNNIPKKHYGRAAFWSRVSDSGDTINRLVTVKQSAASLMKVVDPKIKIGEIKFDEGGEVTIPSQPAVDAKSLHEALDNTAGFAIFSAFRKTFSGLRNTERGILLADPTERNVEIYRALETMRVNSRGLKENPGFADYIESATNYVYNGYQLPDEWDKENPAAQLASIMSPLIYGKRVGEVGTKPYADKAAAAERISMKYVERNAVDIGSARDAIREIVKLLDIPEDDKTPQESPLPMSLTPDGGRPLDERTKEEVDARIDMEQELVKGDPHDGDGYGRAEKTTLKVKPPYEGRGGSINVPGAIAKADAHLRLKKTLDKRTEHFQKSGDLDEDELYRLMQRDDRVFMNVEEEQEESASIHFLVDASGSMEAGVGSGHGYGGYGPTRLSTAIEMAWLMAHSMNKRQHVKAHVWAHTGDGPVTGSAGRARHDGPVVYDIWQTGEDLNRLNIIKEIYTANNYDGYAIKFVGSKLEKEEAEKKYLIVLSDGQPSAHGYGGVAGMDHVREVTDALLKKNIHVVQIAIGGISASQQARMFKHFVEFTTLDATIKKFAKILDKAR